MSLKAKLHNTLKTRGYLSLQEVHEIAHQEGKKESNAERRLRASESPQVKPNKNSKGHIVGYYWIFPLPKDLKQIASIEVRPIQNQLSGITLTGKPN